METINAKKCITISILSCGASKMKLPSPENVDKQTQNIQYIGIIFTPLRTFLIVVVYRDIKIGQKQYSAFPIVYDI